MELLYKPDAAQACARMAAWWEGAILDRATIHLTAPKPTPQPLPTQAYPSEEARWLDVEGVVARADRQAANTYWAGDALPMFWPNLGPEILTGCMGAPLTFGATTSWSTPILYDWADIPTLQIQPDNLYLQTLLAMIRLGLEVGKGKFVVGLTDIHPGADLAASFRDPQQLCVDILDAPEQVHALNVQLFPTYFDFYEMQRALLLAAGQTYTSSWLPLFAEDGRYYIPSCDFSIMISTAMFEEFFLPELLAEIDWLDRSIYHLDGPGALRHLDTLLAIEKLDAIQFVYGDGSGPATRWLPVYRRIQDAGKRIHVSLTPGEIDAFMDALRPEGVMLSTTAGSVEEADAILAKIAKWTHRMGA
jgi:hypothetical protein